MVLKGVRGSSMVEVDRDCIIVNEGTDNEPIMAVKNTKAELDLELDKYFAKWFGNDANTWAQKWEGGRPAGTHPLFREDEEGWQHRKYLVNADHDSQEYQTWKETMVMGMPKEVQWVLELYERKHVNKLGRKIEQRDYDRRGVMKPITEDMWDRFWSHSKGNKAADSKGLHINLVLALKNNRVYDQKDNTGEAPRHIFVGLMKLVKSSLQLE